MDIGTVITVVGIGATGAGTYIGGRITGKSSASQIAADTVNILQAHVEALRADKESKDAELTDLRARVDVLESLVTQRAEVAELSGKVDEVKHTVDLIAVRVGA